MKTYEVNIVCDACGNECVSGDPIDSVIEATKSSIEEALRQHWHLASGNDYCPNCKEKQQGVTP